ncbi:glutaredoxin-related protein 5, mitochondrial-like [Gigantopelta aegis]|uniref:glutaredoxin-related protein 5, mitochondrial-like n=1 Tax=Gigantopelta aegis TaxID=1735272 RepID=UPI001B88B729|nr:glutaredoxin-related protein 5, mitochondrial-like [Gigantopelta aegis]
MNRLLARCLLSSYRSNCGRLLSATFSASAGTKDHINNLVKGKKIVIFMKGTPENPRCGFSKAVVQILNFHGVQEFDAYNVLEDEDLRQGIKEYSKWPTIPQVYMNGEFIGGCDILLDMHKNGELVEELKTVGIRSALLDHPNKQA